MDNKRGKKYDDFKESSNNNNNTYSSSNENSKCDRAGKVKRNKNRGNNRRNSGIADDSKSIINNAAWYIEDPELRAQVGGYSMNSTIGLPTPFNYNSQNTTISHEPFQLVVPSVLAMECNPSPGFTPNQESGKLSFAAINKAARMLYSDISAINAKTTKYQPQDLVFAILSVGEIISMVSHLTRVYGVAFNYSQRNRDIPDALITAMKMEPKSLLKDLSGFRMDLNEILVTANQITMFSNIPYFQKCWDMYSQIYTDSLSTMSQIYMTVPYSTWVMDENQSTGTSMKTRVLLKPDGKYLTAEEWLATLEEMIDALLTSTTYNYIYTDILNYVSKKGGSLYSFGYVSEMYRVSPVYNLEYLLQIHNATPYGIPVNNDVTQNVVYNSIEFHPAPENCIIAAAMDKVLDFPHTFTPSEEDKINALVYHCVSKVDGKVDDTHFTIGDAALSDHYPVQFTIVSGNNVTHSDGYKIYGDATYQKLVDYISKFDWAPIIYTVDTSGKVVGVVGDLNFYDTIPYNVIKRTYGYSFLGLFKLMNK